MVTPGEQWRRPWDGVLPLPAGRGRVGFRQRGHGACTADAGCGDAPGQRGSDRLAQFRALAAVPGARPGHRRLGRSHAPTALDDGNRSRQGRVMGPDPARLGIRPTRVSRSCWSLWSCSAQLRRSTTLPPCRSCHVWCHAPTSSARMPGSTAPMRRHKRQARQWVLLSLLLRVWQRCSAPQLALGAAGGAVLSELTSSRSHGLGRRSSFGDALRPRW
jgi:hypothetical protein